MNNMMNITNNIQTYPNFKARKVAEVSPVINGLNNKIEIYRVHKTDKEFLQNFAPQIDLSKLLPTRTNAKNFFVWQDIINTAFDVIGLSKKQMTLLAVKDNKPCGIIVANKNRKQGCVELFATWPTEIEKRVKMAGSALFTTMLNMAHRNHLQKISLEPIINGPTDAVRFYLSHGMQFPDKKSSVMTANANVIQDVSRKLQEELNFVECSKQPRMHLKSIIK